VTVSDGVTECDKSKSFPVTCPGDNNLCEGKTCDAGNQCVAAECNEATGDCETSNVGSGVGCDLGELTTNGGFELGSLEGWTTFCDGPNNGSCEATDAEANGGSYSGRVVTAGAPANPLIKQANVGVGIVTANSPITISFDLKGTLSGDGGVVKAEFISEFSGGGGSLDPLGTLFPTDEWVSYSFETTTGGDVGGGVTLQLVAVCGAVAGCGVDAYFDNVSIVFGSGEGTCDGQGSCVPSADCSVPGDCPDDGNECTDAVCDAGTCGTSNNTNLCDGENGTCSAGVCVPNAECSAPGDCPDDGNECTDPVCNAGVCETSNNTVACDNGNGTCNAGVCEPNAEVVFSDDFEPPETGLTDAAALSGKGWVFFVNVFDDQGTRKFGYNNPPQGAPNATADTDMMPPETFISAVVSGEGGAEQGDQQLSVFSDYNCCQGTNEGHFNGTDLVELNVFQERVIGAGDIGKTLTFSFDAKGDVDAGPAGNTTANAFIKTLDPGTGFLESDADRVDTTSLAATWNSFTLSLDIDGTTIAVGHILQFGYQNNASNFESSNVFYDNSTLTSE